MADEVTHAGDQIITRTGHQDLHTGKHYDVNGDEIATGIDDTLREQRLRELAPRQHAIVGNIADLDRMGALAAAGRLGGVADAVAVHPSIDPAELGDVAEVAKPGVERAVDTKFTGESDAKEPESSKAKDDK